MAQAIPVLVLVGRPNVGKSTLFNRLTGSRDALVADLPGLTRDRQYGRGLSRGRPFIVVDTGGLSPETGDPLAALAESQAQLALEEADCVLFLADARSGPLPADYAIADRLRRMNKPVHLLANMAEGLPRSEFAEFHALGLGEPVGISAQHGDGVSALMDQLLAGVEQQEAQEDDDGAIRVAVIGRPNAGKSTLVNRLLGESRVLTADLPGTTRDTIRVPFEYHGHRFVLMDTAGIRRRSRVSETLEKFSIVKALEAVESAQVVIAMVDAREAIGAHDARLLGLAARYGRAMVLAVNKWDSLDTDQRREIKTAVDYRMPFLDFVPLHFISALHGSSLRELMRDVIRAYRATNLDMSTPELNKVLERAVDRHQPPAVVGRRIKLRYAHQSGRNPPSIMIHGNQTQRLPSVYKRYLANAFRQAFDLKGVPLRLEFKTGDNPYEGKPSGRPPKRNIRRERK